MAAKTKTITIIEKRVTLDNILGIVFASGMIGLAPIIVALCIPEWQIRNLSIWSWFGIYLGGVFAAFIGILLGTGLNNGKMSDLFEKDTERKVKITEDDNNA